MISNKLSRSKSNKCVNNCNCKWRKLSNAKNNNSNELKDNKLNNIARTNSTCSSKKWDFKKKRGRKMTSKDNYYSKMQKIYNKEEDCNNKLNKKLCVRKWNSQIRQLLYLILLHLEIIIIRTNKFSVNKLNFKLISMRQLLKYLRLQSWKKGSTQASLNSSTRTREEEINKNILEKKIYKQLLNKSKDWSNISTNKMIFLKEKFKKSN